MGELVVADMGPADISAVLKLAREYVARTSYQEVGMDERAVVLGLAQLPVANPNSFKAFCVFDGDRLMAFLYAERMHPWFNPGKSVATEMFYAVVSDAPANLSETLLNYFEAWAFQDPSTAVAIFQSMIGFGRGEAVRRFMEGRGYEATEQTFLMRRPKTA
jgi:hypothetical protein